MPLNKFHEDPEDKPQAYGYIDNDEADNIDEEPYEEFCEDDGQFVDAIAACYYGEPGICEGELWVCETCGNEYCDAHFHDTDLGHNIECVACERYRLESLPLD